MNDNGRSKNKVLEIIVIKIKRIMKQAFGIPRQWNRRNKQCLLGLSVAFLDTSEECFVGSIYQGLFLLKLEEFHSLLISRFRCKKGEGHS